MIKEIFLYFTAKASKQAKTFGHLYEAIAIGEREKRCKDFWQPHRMESKKLILEIAASIQEKESLLILGSGPLHEIPITELASMFKKITLVDVVHLRSTKKQYQYLSNMEFIEYDITELEARLMKEKKIINTVPKAFLVDHYNLVISANILSQLAYHLRAYLEKNASPNLTEEQLNQFSNQVSNDHVDYLKKFTGKVLLITDIETYFKDKKNTVIKTEFPYLTINFPPPVKTWLWEIAPIPEYNSEISLQMKVAGFIL